ncbi:VanW family protein [Thermoflavimicrobium dichotomicum]|uniref:Putative peptidoglycan binding domain-containing protein n=1 Tax=Thermoflavimicrobium dichotomicum TaxID=46223 RepID=A0A1I3JF95_9BACL|nr:VanW family protein [Thermoflavimicrobium dichotomicum]SFI58780.1 Putative peptidoglycan binding domain-containing protein [Thermoflavimicrobium dichotomicum]
MEEKEKDQKDKSDEKEEQNEKKSEGESSIEDSVDLDGFAFDTDSSDSSSSKEAKTEDTSSDISLFDQWSTDEEKKVEAKSEQEEQKDTEKEVKKELKEEDTSQQEADLSIFDQWGTDEKDQKGEEKSKEKQPNEKVVDLKESESEKKEQEKEEQPEEAEKKEEVKAEGDDLLFASADETKQELEEKKEDKESKAEVVAEDKPKAEDKPEAEDKPKTEEKKAFDDVAFFETAFVPKDEAKPASEVAKPDLPPTFEPPKVETRIAPVPTEEKSSVFKRSKKLIAGMVAAGLLLFGGVAAYQFTQTEYYKTDVRPMFTGYKIKLQSDKKTYELDLKSIGYDGSNPSTIDKKKLVSWLEGIRKELDQPAKNAKFKNKKAETGIEPEKVGHLVDTKQMAEWFKEENIKKLLIGPRKIPMIEDKPTLTAQDLKSIDSHKVGKFTTDMGATEGNRVTNIRLASRTIDGLVLQPGEVFSWNGYVGDTTADKGYKPAGVIVNKKLVQGYGGGICQVSTTLFNAVEKAGLKIVERTAHSKPVGYVPIGRDATIAYPYTDFKFMNNMDKPVVIKADASTSLVTVEVFTVPGAKTLSKEELKELKKVRQKTESFSKLILGIESKEEKEIDLDSKPDVKVTDDMQDAPIEPKDKDNANSL